MHFSPEKVKLDKPQSGAYLLEPHRYSAPRGGMSGLAPLCLCRGRHPLSLQRATFYWHCIAQLSRQSQASPERFQTQPQIVLCYNYPANRIILPVYHLDNTAECSSISPSTTYLSYFRIESPPIHEKPSHPIAESQTKPQLLLWSHSAPDVPYTRPRHSCLVPSPRGCNKLPLYNLVRV
jgi:hypothetical protein